MRDRFDRDLEQLLTLDEAAGPARRIDDRRAAAIIAGALGGAGFPPPASGAAGGGAGGGHGVRALARGIVRSTAGKLAIAAGGTAAVALAGWIAVRSPAPPPAPVRVAAAGPTATAPSPSPAAPSTPSADVSAQAAEASAPARSGSDDSDEIEMLPPPGRSGPTREHPVPGRTRSRRHAQRVAVAEPSPRGEPPTTTQDDPPAAPEDLLAAANAARAQRRWRDADALYGRVVAAAGAELAAQAALVASGSLHLEHLGDPAGAAQRFRAALARGPRGALAEDARWGLAEAARATGDAAEERRALDDFLAQHPSSARAPRARARLAEIGGS